MSISEKILLISSCLIALATICYTVFSGITISKLNQQNKFLMLDSHNKLAEFLRNEWQGAGYNKIVAKVKNYSAYSFIKSFAIKPKDNSPEQIEFFNSIKNAELLTVDQLDKVIGITRKLNNLIKEDKLNIDTVLLYFEFIYGDTEWACREDYSIIIGCINSLYKSDKKEKIRVINEFFNMIALKRNYSALLQTINKNIIE
jgi:hypothetical protein